MPEPATAVTIGRIVRSSDFERVLATSPRTRTPHFALHHLRSPAAVGRPRLSTEGERVVTIAVDDLPVGRWLGLVVPKRHARRATTRNLLKRSIRATARQHAESLSEGLWIVRLREAFAPDHFVSASSPALRRAVLVELQSLFSRAATV